MAVEKAKSKIQSTLKLLSIAVENYILTHQNGAPAVVFKPVFECFSLMQGYNS